MKKFKGYEKVQYPQYRHCDLNYSLHSIFAYLKIPRMTFCSFRVAKERGCVKRQLGIFCRTL
jgi:hypothetical protein